jgi:hypothetical protein
MDSSAVKPRAEMLTATNLGVWLLVRVDPATAASVCRATALEIVSWRRPADRT